MLVYEEEVVSEAFVATIGGGPAAFRPRVECSICLEVSEAQTKVPRIDSCQHRFHRECLAELFTKGFDKCPMCRTVMII